MAHLIPARQVIAGSGAISTGNHRVITQEWLATLWLRGEPVTVGAVDVVLDRAGSVNDHLDLRTREGAGSPRVGPPTLALLLRQPARAAASAGVLGPAEVPNGVVVIGHDRRVDDRPADRSGQAVADHAQRIGDV